MLTVYSKASCTYCDMAKNYLKSKNIPFEEVRVDLDVSKRDWLVEQGHRTLPQIYLNGTIFVSGGYQGLVELSESVIRERLGESNVSE